MIPAEPLLVRDGLEDRSLRIPGKGTCDVCRRTRVLFRFEKYLRRCAEC